MNHPAAPAWTIQGKKQSSLPIMQPLTYSTMAMLTAALAPSTTHPASASKPDPSASPRANPAEQPSMRELMRLRAPQSTTPIIQLLPTNKLRLLGANVSVSPKSMKIHNQVSITLIKIM